MSSTSNVQTDVREPAEYDEGFIPSAINIPIASQPDALFLSPQEFEDRFGFIKPPADKEVVFYCKAGVRSAAAAKLARQGGYDRVGEYPGSWLDWTKNGLIIAASVLVAAGIAVYENPQVQEWFENTRRKFAHAWFPDDEEEISESSLADRTEDARKSRYEIMVENQRKILADIERRNRRERREKEQQQEKQDAQEKAHESSPRPSSSFDDFLERDPDGAYSLQHTALETEPDSQGLRNRGHSKGGAQADASPTNPFADNAGTDHASESHSLLDGQETTRMEAVPETSVTESPATLSAIASPDTLSESETGPLISLPSSGQSSPRSTELTPTLSRSQDSPLPESSSNYFSINEWAEHTSPSFYSPPSSQVNASGSDVRSIHSSEAASIAGSGEDVGDDISDNGQEGSSSRYLDVLSDDGGMSTPGSWTEVGSEISEADAGAVDRSSSARV
ncbi:MAG: hypothetical protein M1825_004486 [Sarcosagium campestre]|nr:MAG: hypothetical protein M1825_004486 [Sarcosagium campestre]